MTQIFRPGIACALYGARLRSRRMLEALDQAATLRAIRALLDDLDANQVGQVVQVVQLKPDAHPTFGGALFRIRKAERGILTGYPASGRNVSQHARVRGGGDRNHDLA